jgi:tRNA-specific 2-thiouridylase
VIGSVSELVAGLAARQRVEAQPRYRARAEPASARLLADGRIELVFDKPQRALAAGQICAFYDGGQLLGGGVFEEIQAP